MSQQNLQPMDERRHILIVDDHADIRRSVAAYLSREGFQCGTADCARAMDAYLVQHSVDLIILDVMMPGEDGLSICKRLTSSQDLPILMLSALDSSEDAIAGLDLGADDYLAKPFNPKELVARIQSVLRRRARVDSEPVSYAGQVLKFGGVVLEYDARLITRTDGQKEILTSAEVVLLTILLERARSVISREDLLKLSTGREAGPLDRTIDNQISRLRKKIEPDVLRPRIISTVRNGGYSLSCDVVIMK